jgi:cytidylate kinase
MESKSISIDGPSGAGKSTLARLTAKKFGLIYVDTGALYRTVGLFARKSNVASKDIDAVTKLLPDIDIEMRYDDDGVQRMILNGDDVTDEIRLPEVSIYASDVSAMAPVRAFLLQMQRDMAVKYDVIMDGRDIGTVVMPGAGLKVFLTAAPDIRAHRRFSELEERGVSTSYDEVLRDITYRDVKDSSRAAAPLRMPDDAILLDNSEIDLAGSFKKLCEIIKVRFGA